MNWAARAEHDHAGAAFDDFAFLFLGRAARLRDRQPTARMQTQGHATLAGGDGSPVLTAGPRGRADPFHRGCFGQLGLRQAGATAIDVDQLLAALVGPGARAAATRRVLGQAIAGVLAAIVALADPEIVVVSETMGPPSPSSSTSSRRPPHACPGSARVRAAELTAEPSLAGVRLEALSRLRSAILAAAHQAQGRPPARTAN